MAFVSMTLSLVTYFSGYMNFSLTKSVTTLTNFMGTTFLLTLVGGFISETYLSRFKTCLLFASFELMVILFLFTFSIHTQHQSIQIPNSIHFTLPTFSNYFTHLIPSVQPKSFKNEIVSPITNCNPQNSFIVQLCVYDG